MNGIFLHAPQDLFDGVHVRFQAVVIVALVVITLEGKGSVAFIDIKKQIHDLGIG